MSTDHLILCGGIQSPTRQRAPSSAERLELKSAERHGTKCSGNVNLKISDIRKSALSGLPAIASDLIEVAAYVYAADQATTRGGTHSFEYGEKWRRHFRFEIPVRRPAIWNSSEVKESLTSTLTFLSDDVYEFDFFEYENPRRIQSHFEFSLQTPNVQEVDEVVLFSGGLDSLCGAVDEILLQKRRVALVSHTPAGQLEHRQQELVTALRSEIRDPLLQPLHVQAEVNKDQDLNRGFTQRSRSFLYASMAAVIARIFKLDRIRFYENGVVSLNLPLSAQVLGGRATRSTHPRALSGFQGLFSQLFKTDFRVDNPYQWKTKTDALIAIKEAKFAKLCAKAVSCTHTWGRTREKPHCGKCSQCVDRRLVALAAGLGADEDPPERYEVDVLRGAREDQAERSLIESCVRVFNEIEDIDNPLQFATRFSELVRGYGQTELSNEDFVAKAFEVYKRHANQILATLDKVGAETMAKFRRDELPATCLLSIAYQRARRSDAGTTMAVLIDDETFTVTFNNKPYRFNGRSKLLFNLARAICRRPGHCVWFNSLCEKGAVWDTNPEASTIRGAVTRLKKALKKNGLAELANLIHVGKTNGRPFVIMNAV